MPLEWDDVKNASNEAIHGIGFDQARTLAWDSARYLPDLRRNYAEGRILAYALIGDRLHAMVFTIRNSGLRIISLRKANNREIDRYVEETNRP
ncbi:MAG: BrnT family toxin [Pseudomonadota bacterium]